jgi:hypothetical protein
MEGETVIYDGRVVPKDGFHVFVYAVNGEQKLVKSWDEYQRCISSGVWFQKKVQAEAIKPPELVKASPIEASKEKKRGKK